MRFAGQDMRSIEYSQSALHLLIVIFVSIAVYQKGLVDDRREEYNKYIN